MNTPIGIQMRIRSYESLIPHSHTLRGEVLNEMKS